MAKIKKKKPVLPTVVAHSELTDFDIELFRSGKHFRLYEKMGAHPMKVEGTKGTYFAVWAPNAQQVHVMGDFNGWNKESHPLYVRWDSSGIWEGFVPGAKAGHAYKYLIHTSDGGQILEKGDPFGFQWEEPPRTASVIWESSYKWKDKTWMAQRAEQQALDHPFSVYELHLGSWRRKMEEDQRSLSYAELAEELVAYVSDMGFTHVEFLPVMEHPFYGSWGYQLTGYFAPTSRYGNPDELKALIDACHKAKIGVILDWVPSHFPEDAHGLALFDGTHLYEHADPRLGFHPDWKSCIFNYGRNEVRSFLISNAVFWVDQFHADGLRVDAVASMLYLDYSRKAGEWVPNRHGGRENLEAISLLKEMNEAVYGAFPGVQTIAEESTAWPGVSRPTYLGGLGFGQKWMMGWMHDTLEYFKKDPFYRQYHQNDITFSMTYAFTENFMLPLSHDEVVHGKGPLIDRMPGDEWQRFANLRLLYGYMFTHPGTKLLFMGGEFGQTSEWNHDGSLDWHLLEFEPHKGVQQLVRERIKMYRKEQAFSDLAFDASGFEWIDYADHSNSVIAYLRKGHPGTAPLLVVCNFTPVVRENYRLGVPGNSKWQLVLNTDHKNYWGSGALKKRTFQPKAETSHGREYSLELTLPPLAMIVLKPEA